MLTLPNDDAYLRSSLRNLCGIIYASVINDNDFLAVGLARSNHVSDRTHFVVGRNSDRYSQSEDLKLLQTAFFSVDLPDTTAE
jgi:hypothetical protein